MKRFLVLAGTGDGTTEYSGDWTKLFSAASSKIIFV